MRLRFPAATFVGGFLLVGTAIGAAYWMVEDPETAQHRYHQLLQVANPMNSRQDASSYVAKQKREGIQKSFYFTPPKAIAPQELRLFASNSELILNRTDKSEISEKLEDLKAMIQESLYYVTPNGKESFAMAEEATPMQKITYLESETADCDYTNGRLVAQRAEITRFTLFGHELLNRLEEGNITPYQSASAENVDFQYHNGILELTGDVALDHHEGKDLLQLTCDQARLYDEEKIPVVEAHKNVSLVFNSTFTVTGDVASFSKGEVHVLGNYAKCLLTSLAGDRVQSDKIDVSLNTGILEMDNPEGFLYPIKEDPVPLKFSSENLLWNHRQNQLILHSDVEILHPTLGHLKNPDEVHIFRAEGKGGGSFEKIISEGHSTLTRKDLQTQRLYTLVCEGRVLLDHVNGQVELVASDPVTNPVHLKDEYGEVFADTAQIFYTPTPGRLQNPHKIVLKGNVKIINRSSLLSDTSAVMHMALADKVEINPASNEMVFYATRGKRALFYDKGNDIQISAPKLTVRRNQQTKKESFEGAGDVRFTFQDREISLLREKFSLPFISNKDKK